MDDATQKLVDEARRAIENHDPAEPCPAVDVIPRLADALEAVSLANATNAREADEALRALEAAQRPPVSPEVEDALVDAIEEAWTDDDPEFSRVIARRILAWFSVPSQPVYDEEAAMTAFDEAFEEDIALRGGELTREETNRG